MSKAPRISPLVRAAQQRDRMCDEWLQVPAGTRPHRARAPRHGPPLPEHIAQERDRARDLELEAAALAAVERIEELFGVGSVSVRSRRSG